MATEGNATHQDWRELARRIQEENDPQKMIELVQQLIEKFDAAKLRNNLPPTRKPENPSGPPEE